MPEIKVTATEKGIKIDWMALSKVDGLLTPTEARDLQNQLVWALFDWAKLTGKRVEEPKPH